MRIFLPLYVSLVALSLGSARYFNDYYIINGQGQGHQSHDGYDDVIQAYTNDVGNACRDSPQYEYPFECKENGKEFDSFNSDNQESRDYSKELENVEEYSIIYQTNDKNQEDEQDNGFHENGYQRILDWIYTSGKENKNVYSNDGNKNGNQRMQTKNNGGRGYSQHRKQDRLGNGFLQHGFVNNGKHSSKGRNGNRGSYDDRRYGNKSPGVKIYNTDDLHNGKNNRVYNDNQSDGRQNDGVYNDANQTDGLHIDGVYNDANQTDGLHIDGVHNNDNHTGGLHTDGVYDDNQSDEHLLDGVYNDGNQTDGVHTDGVYNNNNQTNSLHTDRHDANQTDGRQNDGVYNDANQTDGRQNDGVYNDANQTDGRQNDGVYNDANQTDGRQNDDGNQSTEQNKDGYQTTKGMRLYMNRANDD